MSENELVERVKKKRRKSDDFYRYRTEAAQEIGRIAEKENVEWALVGGIAMYLYGSPRLTKDVDIIADKIFDQSKPTHL